MVPSSSEEVTRSIGGQPERLSRNYQRRTGGASLYMFWFRFIAEIFSALSVASLLRRAFFVLCSFGCLLFCCLFGFRKFKIKQFSTVTATSTMTV